jgi:REP element-mobilizing transposase RayT
MAAINIIMRRRNREPEQLDFDRRRWGGRRPGAGRKPGPHPRIRHLSRTPFAGGMPCHVTLKVRPDVPSLRTVRFVREIERSFAQSCERGTFRIVHYSLQGNHTHLIVEAVNREALGRGMKSLAARLARAVNRVFERSGAVLADRYHHRVLRTPREVRNALAYVLLNARKHAVRAGAKLTRALRLDPASSGRWFDGWSRAPEPSPPEPHAVSPPRDWLLRVGWRRWGLLDPSELPGR